MASHIASLLITFFCRQMPELIRAGHLFLAVPPLYRLSQGGGRPTRAMTPISLNSKATVFNGRGKLEVSRFKGLGEMMPAQLKETTMHPKKRTLLRVEITGRTGDLNGLDVEADEAAAADIVEQLMGNKPEARFRFIQERAAFAEPDALDSSNGVLYFVVPESASALIRDLNGRQRLKRSPITPCGVSGMTKGSGEEAEGRLEP